jgi:hypothetical protein
VTADARKMKTAVRDRRYRVQAWRRSLLLFGFRLVGGVLALQVSEAAFLFDDLVVLLAHGVGK